MATQTKKPKGEPSAATGNVIERPAHWTDARVSMLADQARRLNSGYRMKNAWGEKEFSSSSYDEQISVAKRNGASKWMSPRMTLDNDYYVYMLRNLRDYGVPELQKQNDAQEKQDKKRALQQPKRTSLTGAQGIVGSAMNLGSAGLLGG